MKIRKRLKVEIYSIAFALEEFKKAIRSIKVNRESLLKISEFEEKAREAMRRDLNKNK